MEAGLGNTAALSARDRFASNAEYKIGLFMHKNETVTVTNSP
jgi:hypothetical protein